METASTETVEDITATAEIPIVNSDDAAPEAPQDTTVLATFGITACIRAIRGAHAVKARAYTEEAVSNILGDLGLTAVDSQYFVDKMAFGHSHVTGAFSVNVTEEQFDAVTDQLEHVTSALRMEVPVIATMSLHAITQIRREPMSAGEALAMFFGTMPRDIMEVMLAEMPSEVYEQIDAAIRETAAHAEAEADTTTDESAPVTTTIPVIDDEVDEPEAPFILVEEPEEPQKPSDESDKA